MFRVQDFGFQKHSIKQVQERLRFHLQEFCGLYKAFKASLLERFEKFLYRLQMGFLSTARTAQDFPLGVRIEGLVIKDCGFAARGLLMQG